MRGSKRPFTITYYNSCSPYSSGERRFNHDYLYNRLGKLLNMLRESARKTSSGGTFRRYGFGSLLFFDRCASCLRDIKFF